MKNIPSGPCGIGDNSVKSSTTPSARPNSRLVQLTCFALKLGASMRTTTDEVFSASFIVDVLSLMIRGETGDTTGPHRVKDPRSTRSEEFRYSDVWKRLRHTGARVGLWTGAPPGLTNCQINANTDSEILDAVDQGAAKPQKKALETAYISVLVLIPSQ